MASNGKGISDAVRNAVRGWMTPRLTFHLYEKISPEVRRGSEAWFRNALQSSENWVRITRLRSGDGWLRKYYSKLVGRNLTLHVRSNGEDTHIQYVTVILDDKIIGGGKVNVPSMNVSQRGRDADLSITFEEFTDTEMAELQAQLEFGDAAIHAVLFEERVC